ncbi:ATPase P-type K/Mg/Cd/Cu/Zn/Na/Ca/Na/H-transporter [Botryosphaeria dothidea]|uniref:ATPase P-type K/Mg/Cd/Cu/Zn/Na/Ca/Na/H-transporter n=1 Tax=Botryosphaeria dothidea TaxID=55169 RepID=A0A8H4N660_9PEZI|nr:ATPase P-type K/Mg/Cd/Cu/Zn/Na/Ca/Na/H-transporter [Botryosphaeria dothidea]
MKSCQGSSNHLAESSPLGLVSSLSNLALLGPSAPTHLTTDALLLLVVLFGRTVDLLLRRDATSTLTSLFRLQSELAHVRLATTTNEDREAGTPSFLPAALLAPGDEIVLPAFSTVPCDCYLLSPAPTSLDLSALTGEPTPVAKGPGDPVLAGAREAAGRQFVAVVAKPHADSALARILDGVVEAAGQKARVEEGAVGGMVRRFVGAVLGIAGASAAVEFWGAGGDGGVAGAANAGVQRAMAVVAAACPCALGLAVPAAAMSFLDAASGRGILLTGGAQSIEALTTVTHVVLDKTGTLTKGELQVTEFEALGPLPVGRRVLLQLLCAVEAPDAQVHPVAKAAFAWAVKQLQETGDKPNLARHVTQQSTVLGCGASCVVEMNKHACHHVVVGTVSFLQSQGVRMPGIGDQDPEDVRGISVSIAVDGECIGRLKLHDTPRPEAIEVIQELKKSGYILTMDEAHW